LKINQKSEWKVGNPHQFKTEIHMQDCKETLNLVKDLTKVFPTISNNANAILGPMFKL